MAEPAFAIQPRPYQDDDYSGSSRPIDLVHLAKQSLGDRALEAEVLRMFDAVLVTQKLKMQDPDDGTEMARALHALKGAAAGVGALSVYAQAREVESAYYADGAVNAELMHDLDMAIEEVRTFIGVLLAE